MNEDSALIEQAVQQVLSKGLRTEDIAKSGEAAISTQEMGQAVIDELATLSGK
jgi:3-isopropylmalate dehydrogenase